MFSNIDGKNISICMYRKFLLKSAEYHFIIWSQWLSELHSACKNRMKLTLKCANHWIKDRLCLHLSKTRTLPFILHHNHILRNLDKELWECEGHASTTIWHWIKMLSPLNLNPYWYIDRWASRKQCINNNLNMHIRIHKLLAWLLWASDHFTDIR